MKESCRKHNDINFCVKYSEHAGLLLLLLLLYSWLMGDSEWR